MYYVEVKAIGGWTTHSSWGKRKDACDQADLVRGRVVSEDGSEIYPKQKWFRVELVNCQTIGARCGYGEGKTLNEAQEDALRMAKDRDPNAKLSESGYQVLFAGGVNC